MPTPTLTIRRRGAGIEVTVQTGDGPGASIVLTGKQAAAFEGIAPRFSSEAGTGEITFMQIAPGLTDVQLVAQDVVVPTCEHLWARGCPEGCPDAYLPGRTD